MAKLETIRESIKDKKTKINLRKILKDLHKLGVIIFFDEDILRETVIANPKWFNILFKSVLDLGRKRVCIIFQELYDKILSSEENVENNKNSKNKVSQKKFFLLESKMILEKILKELKRGFSNYSMKQIWQQHRERSVVDKVSYHLLLNKLEKVENSLQWTQSVCKNVNHKTIISQILNSVTNKKNFPISHTLYLIKKDVLQNNIINEVLGGKHIFDREKKKFLLDLLIRYQLILPIQKNTKDDSALFLIPFLYPKNKPSSFLSLQNLHENYFLSFSSSNPFTFQLKIKFFLPYPPSSMWKHLYLPFRNICSANNESKFIEEIYWSDGLFFLFNDDNQPVQCLLETTKVDSSNQLFLISFFFFLNPPIFLFLEQVLSIKLVSSKKEEELHNLKNMLYSATLDYLSKWFDEDKKVSENVQLEKKDSVSKHHFFNLKIKCHNCEKKIFINSSSTECSFCNSTNFLVEKKLAILKIIERDEFRRIFKALHLPTNSIVCLEEKNLDPKAEYRWNLRVNSFSFIEQHLKSSSISLRNCCAILNDSKMEIPKRFIVSEWSDGEIFFIQL